MSVLFPQNSKSSTDQPLRGENIAILVANGFNEHDCLESLRALRSTGAKLTLISPSAGLVQGWNGTTFGHSHAVDTSLSNALAADFSLLLVPSGVRSIEKLKTNAHTTRFIKGFLSYGNPVAFMGDAVALIAHVGAGDGITVSGPVAQQAGMAAVGAVWSDDAITVSAQILTGRTDNADELSAMIAAMVQHFTNIPDNLRLAA